VTSATQPEEETTKAAPQTVDEEEVAEERVLTWPSLVYREFIAAVVVTVGLALISLIFMAPLEEIANPTQTPNPAKAPWYFLGLQELLVYFDPWIAGVALPGLIIIGLMLIPYVDRRPTEGSGGYRFRRRESELVIFCFGYFLWFALIVIGVYLRGRGWAWYWPWENRNVDKVVVEQLRYMPPAPVGWGLLLGYFALGLVLPARLFRKWRAEMERVEYVLVMTFTLLMFSVPLKIILRLVFHYHYLVQTPWFYI